MKINLLFHPKFTLAATVLGVTALETACYSLVKAIDPLKHFSKIAPAIDKVQTDVVGTAIVLGVTVSILLILAGLGRSFAPLIDSGQI